MTHQRRLVLGAILAIAVTLGWVASAHADTNPSVTISDIKSHGDNYQGVLTFRSKEVVQVDPRSVHAAVDGKPVPITIQSTSHLQRTTLLLIDTSGSMGTDGMQTVRQATRVFLQEVPSDVEVGVLRFADSPALVLKPTTDRSAVQHAVNGLSANGETALYAAVRQAATILGTEGDRSIVLLSDGADTRSGQPTKALTADTAALKAQGIRVDVVRFNNTDPAAEKALAQFAKAGGGSDVLATDTAGVAAAFRSSAQALNSQAEFTLKPGVPLGGGHDLTITGTAAGQSFSVAQKVSFGALLPTATPSRTRVAAQPPQQPAVSAPVAASWSWAPWVGGSVLVVAVFLLVYFLLTPSVGSRRERRIATVQSYLQAAAHQASKTRPERGPSALREAAEDLGERVMSRRSSTARTMQLIQRADWPLRAGEWLVVRVLAVVLGALLGALLLGHAALVGLLIGGIVGFVAPSVLLRFTAARRTRAFEKQLPQILALVATSLRSGFGLPQALEAVARDAAEPAAKEFSRALAQVRIGADIADSLDDAATRMGTESLHMTVMAIRIQRQVGGNLAETLDTTAHTLREREALRGQVAALSAEGRLSAWILIAMPIGIFMYMTWVANDYVSLLWSTVAGLVMLIGTSVLLVIGVFWMRKVVQIEV